MAHPLITVIVAVLNRAATVKRCLESIEAQDYPAKELIVMDGGSTDGTLTLLEEYRSHMAYFESASDRGIYHAWNKALKHACGEWVCFLGADDFFWSPHALTEMAPFLIEAAERGIRIVYGQVVKINQAGSVLRVEGSFPTRRFPKRGRNTGSRPGHGSPLPFSPAHGSDFSG
jgi:glycosyltransferase involved in cell wall biosynthesis